MLLESIDSNSFFSNLCDELRIFSNFDAIINKVDRDGHFPLFFDNFKRIFEREVIFAHQELQKMKTVHKGLNIIETLKTNLLVFKENFKIIVTASLDRLYAKLVEPSQLEMITNRIKYQKGDTIIELLDESYFSEQKSKLEGHHSSMMESLLLKKSGFADSNLFPSTRIVPTVPLNLNNQKVGIELEDFEKLEVPEHNSNPLESSPYPNRNIFQETVDQPSGSISSPSKTPGLAPSVNSDDKLPIDQSARSCINAKIKELTSRGTDVKLKKSSRVNSTSAKRKKSQNDESYLANLRSRIARLENINSETLNQDKPNNTDERENRDKRSKRAETSCEKLLSHLERRRSSPTFDITSFANSRRNELFAKKQKISEKSEIEPNCSAANN